MKVLYITYTGLTENLGKSQIIPYFKRLAAIGVEFQVISFESCDRFRHRITEAEAECAGFPIKCHFVNRRETSFILFRAAAILKAIVLALGLVLRNRPNLIHCRNAFAAECAMTASWISGVPYLFDMRGFWGDARKETGRWDQTTLKGRLVYKLWKARERLYVRRSAITNCLTEKAKAWIVSSGYKQEHDVIVTPCCADYSTTVHRQPRSQGSATFICLYVGSMGGVYDDARLFRTFRTIKEVFPGAKLRVLGSKTPAEILAAAEAAGCPVSPKDLQAMKVPHHEVNEWIRSADVGLSFCKPGFFASGVSSTKIGEYLSQGLPVISNAGLGDVQQLLARTQAGLALPDHVSEQAEKTVLVNFLIGLPVMDRGLIQMKARRHLDVSVAVANYQLAYQTISDRRVSQ